MFDLAWLEQATEQYRLLKKAAERSVLSREKSGKRKSSAAEGLFKQVHKTIELLRNNPKHTGLHTHAYDSLPHPFDPNEKVWEAYAQNNTPGAYRVFWCYGPEKKQITIIAITPHT